MASTSPVDVSIAISPADLDAAPRIIQELQEHVHGLAPGIDDARHDLLLKARSLVQALETPRETMIKHNWAQIAAISALNFGVEVGLWKLMAEKDDEPQRVDDLASKLSVDPALLARMMRHLGAMGYLKETDVDAYQTNNFTKAMSIDIIGNGYLAAGSYLSFATLRFHEYSRKHNFENPSDGTDTSLMHACHTDKDAFAWLQSVGQGANFNDHMGGYRQGRPPWMAPGFYPVQERLSDGADPDGAFIVDVGGSVGHDLAEFRKYHPSHPGKLVLQDLPVVIGQISCLDPAIERMPHDFLTEQPIRGARAYYMHSCLHDWPDDVCCIILSHLKDAMKPGYSRLLINENVIPARNAYWETSALDILMMAFFSSRERTERDWHHLLEELAGLKIVKIWSGGVGVESLIEVERVD